MKKVISVMIEGGEKRGRSLKTGSLFVSLSLHFEVVLKDDLLRELEAKSHYIYYFTPNLRRLG